MLAYKDLLSKNMLQRVLLYTCGHKKSTAMRIDNDVGERNELFRDISSDHYLFTMIFSGLKEES